MGVDAVTSTTGLVTIVMVMNLLRFNSRWITGDGSQHWCHTPKQVTKEALTIACSEGRLSTIHLRVVRCYCAFFLHLLCHTRIRPKTFFSFCQSLTLLQRQTERTQYNWMVMRYSKYFSHVHCSVLLPLHPHV